MRSLLACVLGLGIVVAAGCGGKVEVSSTGTPGGSGGAGGASSSSYDTTTTNGVATTGVSSGDVSMMASSSTGAGGGDIQGDCETLCKVTSQQACGGSGATCVQDCVSSYEQLQGCQPQYLSYLDCLAAHAGEIVKCSAPAACDPQLQAFTQCEQGQGGSTGGGGGCGPEECSGSQDSCECQRTCNGQTFAAACKVSGPNGQVTCSCSTGDTVGTCQEPTLACGVFDSCCKQFFAN